MATVLLQDTSRSGRAWGFTVLVHPWASALQARMRWRACDVGAGDGCGTGQGREMGLRAGQAGQGELTSGEGE